MVLKKSKKSAFPDLGFLADANMLKRTLQPHIERTIPTASMTQLMRHQISAQSSTLYQKQIHLTLRALTIAGWIGGSSGSASSTVSYTPAKAAASIGGTGQTLGGGGRKYRLHLSNANTLPQESELSVPHEVGALFSSINPAMYSVQY